MTINIRPQIYELWRRALLVSWNVSTLTSVFSAYKPNITLDQTQKTYILKTIVAAILITETISSE